MSSVAPVLLSRAKTFVKVSLSTADNSLASDKNAAIEPSAESAALVSSARKNPWMAESLVPDLKSPVPFGRETQAVGSVPAMIRPSRREYTWVKSGSACGEQPGEPLVNTTRLPVGAIEASMAG